MSTFTIQTAAPLHLQIAAHIEQRITSGELRDGEKLPTTAELAAEYGVTLVTAQKSLQQLVNLDLVERTPRRGTFVKPHQTANTIGLIFGYSPFRVQNVLYLRMLELFRMAAMQEKINLKIYFDTQECEPSRAFYELRRDVASKKLKALIAVDRSKELSEWLKTQQEIFWVEPPNIDFFNSVNTGTKYLLGKGYRRITVVSMYPPEIPYPDWNENFQLEKAGFEAATAGLDVEARLVRWGQTEIDGYNEGKKVFGNPAQRPDAIFVHHDVVCRGLLLALMELGLKIPQDVALLTHSNMGCEFASPVPLTKVEFDPMEMVKNTISILKKMHFQLPPGGNAAPVKVKSKLVCGKSCGE